MDFPEKYGECFHMGSSQEGERNDVQEESGSRGMRRICHVHTRMFRNSLNYLKTGAGENHSSLLFQMEHKY
jgi:hypothetical protein